MPNSTADINFFLMKAGDTCHPVGDQFKKPKLPQFVSNQIQSIGGHLNSCHLQTALGISCESKRVKNICKEKSNQMQQCIRIFLFHTYMKLNVFRATHRLSSGA
jgi:hypothetical protein